ncbi:L-seryl-tRNA(Sec) selenium transferase [Leptolyngbya sp. 7M]|uniref:L-seryl-tRNA(Sec) selenium transferase n=1 Tax=Leptolyngbya sp. 7M TaxID=2812896 RepID=UPI001B8B928D|nr:L-seryl-tRNA(Sec) selenium transferase [Leptolyngbya sp. 7M]QYO67664.1 L-seryl-tRNA(Sec) selenium transferase [Leptolyngbya sp. 7M]
MLSELPSVDEMLSLSGSIKIAEVVGKEQLTRLVREAISEVRNDICAGSMDLSGGKTSRSELITRVATVLERSFITMQLAKQKRVINATGVIIHTNLGRAPLSQAAREAMDESSAYSNVELDLVTGQRGRRGGGVEDSICRLTGAEASAIVNNCAAAAYLVLSVIAKSSEVIVSRGELVEIGGDFRIPDILERSGAILREVGTTNRTKLTDYERVISDRTAAILRVHPSNYKIIGFSMAPHTRDLAELAHSRNLVFYEDAGSGALIDLSGFGLEDEPVIANVIDCGADVVTFSGDKLLGGPQAGIIAGKRDLIERIRRDPLFRALRANKLTYAALDATLAAYLRGTHFEEIPVLRMFAMSPLELAERTRSFISKFVDLRVAALVIF